MKSFLDVERAQAAQLESFRATEADAGVLSRLVEMSCLLELSKLATARLNHPAAEKAHRRPSPSGTPVRRQGGGRS